MSLQTYVPILMLIVGLAFGCVLLAVGWLISPSSLIEQACPLRMRI